MSNSSADCCTVYKGVPPHSLHSKPTQVLEIGLGQSLFYTIYGAREIQGTENHTITSRGLSREEMQYLTHEEVRTFSKVAKEDRLEVLYILAVTTGLRQGEILDLKWEDIDFDAGKISAQRNLSAAKNDSMFDSRREARAAVA